MQIALWVLVVTLAFQCKTSRRPLPPSRCLTATKRISLLGLKCADCHTNPEPGDRMEFPETSRCMACHTTIAKDKPAIQKLAEFAKSKQPIPWARVYAVQRVFIGTIARICEAGM